MIPTPSFYTDETLMQEWGIDRDTLECYVVDGLLIRSLKTLAGEPRQGITADERRRFEGATKREPIQHPTQRKGDRLLLAMLLAVWTGEDATFIEDDKDRHYRLRDQVASDVKLALGMDLPRSAESDALAIKEGFELLRARGWKPRRPREPEPQPVVDEIKEQAA